MILYTPRTILGKGDILHMYIERAIEKEMHSNLFKGKAIILYGPRQCGKTTLVRHLVDSLKEPCLWLTADDATDCRIIEGMVDLSSWKMVLEGNRIIVIDEAQKARNIGRIIKIAVDSIKDVQIIATGSSSFALAQKSAEPLTGRKLVYTLLPLSYGELVGYHGSVNETRSQQQRLVYGSYPSIITQPDDARRTLEELSTSYLLRDVLSLDGVRRPRVLQDLVRALAFQVCGEVSLNELAQTVGVDRLTVDRYITILEQAFIVFSLPAYSGNERNEIRKRRKIYFYDTGMLNAVRANVSPLSARSPQEVGALWENYLVSERKKLLVNEPFGPKQYFWRNTAKAEIDYIELKDGKLAAWEITYNDIKKPKIPIAFRKAYPDTVYDVLSPATIRRFLLPPTW